MESGDGPGATDILKELLSVRADRDDLWRLLSNMLKAWDQCWELVELLNEWGYHRVSEGLLVTFIVPPGRGQNCVREIAGAFPG